jgi:hypothetical protein
VWLMKNAANLRKSPKGIIHGKRNHVNLMGTS